MTVRLQIVEDFLEHCKFFLFGEPQRKINKEFLRHDVFHFYVSDQNKVKRKVWFMS